MHVVTQGTNEAACCCYERFGFRKDTVQRVYHMWLPEHITGPLSRSDQGPIPFCRVHTTSAECKPPATNLTHLPPPCPPAHLLTYPPTHLPTTITYTQPLVPLPLRQGAGLCGAGGGRRHRLLLALHVQLRHAYSKVTRRSRKGARSTVRHRGVRAGSPPVQPTARGRSDPALLHLRQHRECLRAARGGACVRGCAQRHSEYRRDPYRGSYHPPYQSHLLRALRGRLLRDGCDHGDRTAAQAAGNRGRGAGIHGALQRPTPGHYWGLRVFLLPLHEEHRVRRGGRLSSEPQCGVRQQSGDCEGEGNQQKRLPAWKDVEVLLDGCGLLLCAIRALLRSLALTA
mmetsp:Transcript_4975/g.10873  ORF Transcript_4975/g.10873 Transcript_4975/m.10873 type:complete len:342 (+) Transcript_4975:1772-2797(+)